MIRTFSLISAVSILALASACAEERRWARMSPDEAHLVEWIDHDAGENFGQIRKIVFREAAHPFPIFRFLSIPGRTIAEWNPASSKLILSDDPDSEEPRTWLFRMNNDGRWSKTRIDLFADLRTEFAQKGNESKVFDPMILEIAWTSDSSVEFHTICKIGTFLITVDTKELSMRPTTKKLSGNLMEPKKKANKAEMATPRKPSD